MKNSPYLTLLLIVIIEYLLYIYLDYAKIIYPTLPIYDYIVPIMIIAVSICGIITAFFTKNYDFRWFVMMVLLPAALVLAAAIYFIGQFGRGFNH